MRAADACVPLVIVPAFYRAGVNPGAISGNTDSRFVYVSHRKLVKSPERFSEGISRSRSSLRAARARITIFSDVSNEPPAGPVPEHSVPETPCAAE